MTRLGFVVRLGCALWLVVVAWSLGIFAAAVGRLVGLYRFLRGR